jgi:hypothetical protein
MGVFMVEIGDGGLEIRGQGKKRVIGYQRKRLEGRCFGVIRHFG